MDARLETLVKKIRDGSLDSHGREDAEINVAAILDVHSVSAEHRDNRRASWRGIADYPLLQIDLDESGVEELALRVGETGESPHVPTSVLWVLSKTNLPCGLSAMVKILRRKSDLMNWEGIEQAASSLELVLWRNGPDDGIILDPWLVDLVRNWLHHESTRVRESAAKLAGILTGKWGVSQEKLR